jgi:hypothetical protein
MALRRTYAAISQTPVAGRNVRKLIILLTDGFCEQLTGLETLAAQIKAKGVDIMLLAIQNAISCENIQGSKVASPGMFFSADSYANLAADAIVKIESMANQMCSPLPNYDLSMTITDATCDIGAVNYTVNNNGLAAFNGTVHVSFYDGNPTLATTKLLASTSDASQAIPAGGTINLTHTASALANQPRLYGVVNIDPTKSATPLPPRINSLLAITTETIVANNTSAIFTSTNCTAVSGPRLVVSKTAVGIDCNKNAVYSVQICNTGSADASNVTITDFPELAGVLLSSVSSTDMSPVVGKNRYTVSGVADTENASGDDGWTNGVQSYYQDESRQLPLFINEDTRAGYCFQTSPSPIPKTAIITSAKFNFVYNSTGSGTSPLTLAASIIPNMGRFQGNAIHDLDQNPIATKVVTLPSTVERQSISIDVADLVQTLVRNNTWDAQSAIAITLKASIFAFFKEHSTADPSLDIEYYYELPTFTLAAGRCNTATLVYDMSSGTEGQTYQNSVGVSTSSSNAIILPNSNFSVGSSTGINGYNGAANTGDEVTIPNSSCPPLTLAPLTTAVSITPTSSCATDGNVTATVTITNPNATSLPGSATDSLYLSGTGASFSSEVYNITNGLIIAEPDMLDPDYPAADDSTALYGKAGPAGLILRSIPPGTSSFSVDIRMGTTLTNLRSVLANLPSIYNPTGKSEIATDAQGVAAVAKPTANITAPVNNSSISSAVGTPITLTGTTTGTGSGGTATWSAGQNANITRTGTIAAPGGSYTITAEDKANGYIDVMLIATTSEASGTCDAAAGIRVILTGANYDYGDAPISYDYSKTAVPYAAAALNPSTTLKLGTVNSDAEAANKPSTNADGDNTSGTNDEDGVASFAPHAIGQTSYAVTVTATNTTGAAAAVAGWIDWNNDGIFSPQEGATVVPVPTGTNNGSFVLQWSNINKGAGISCDNQAYARFRIARSITEFDYIGPTDGGEVEDYRLPLTVFDMGNLPAATWPVASASISTSNAVWLGGTTANPDGGKPTNECATTLTDAADGLSVKKNGSLIGAGSTESPFQMDFSEGINTFDFGLTINASGAAKPVYWAIWYDVDGNGRFTDDIDAFVTGVNNNTNAPHTIATTVPLTNPSADGSTLDGKIRVVATATDYTFTKQQNGQVNVINGEVEDYYVSYLTLLPVALANFEAQKQNGSAILLWQTLTEQNSKAFVVERSANGTNDWLAIGSVSAAGTSNTTKKYSFYDSKPLAGKNYYRLLLSDNDGRTTLSEIKMVDFSQPAAIGLSPNPTTDYVAVTGLSNRSAVFLFDVHGRMLQQRIATGPSLLLNVSGFASGTYFVRVMKDGRPVFISKFTKQ